MLDIDSTQSKLEALGALELKQTIIAIHAQRFTDVAVLLAEKAKGLEGLPYAVTKCDIYQGLDGLWHGVIYLV